MLVNPQDPVAINLALWAINGEEGGRFGVEEIGEEEGPSDEEGLHVKEREQRGAEQGRDINWKNLKKSRN